MIAHALRPVAFTGRVGLLLTGSAAALVRGRVLASDILVQMVDLGVRSLPVVLATVLFTSSAFAYHLEAIVREFGLRYTIGGTVAMATIREVAPVMCAVCLIARCGSAMTAEIGAMRVTEQIDALRSLSVSPVSYLVAPRVVAATLMTPVLNIYGMMVGIAAGMIVAYGGGVSPAVFLSSMAESIRVHDVAGGSLKTVVFGLVIALIACERGLNAEGGAKGVGRATTQAVVLSLLAVYALNYLLDICLW